MQLPEGIINTNHNLGRGCMRKEGTERQIKVLKQLRDRVGMNSTEFAGKLGIPLRTMEEWESGNRRMPDYLLRLLAYYVMGRFIWFKEQDECCRKMEEEMTEDCPLPE